MKTIIVQGDGIASDALPELDGQTPLQVAKTPNLDDLAKQSECGSFTLSQEKVSLSSAATHLALLGYDPSKYFSGLAPFEAASLEVVLEQHDMAFLCQLVTLSSTDGRGDSKKLGSHLILDDERAGGIDSEDARDVIDAINEQLGSETIQFYTGDRHRHLMVWIGSNARCICHDPRAVHGHSIEPFLPSGNGADVLIELMEASRILLRHHPLNQEREQAGLKPVNCLWLWGPGKAIELPKWKQQGVITSATISPSGVHRGIAICAGIDVLNLQNSSEEPQTEFSQYLKACQDALQSKDFVYLHVPMPYMDRATALQSSLKSIETFDEQLIGPLMQSISEHEDTRFLVVCNHDDEEARGTNRSPTPYAYLQNTGGPPVGPQPSFHEMNAAKGPSRDAIKFASRMLAT